MKTEKAVYKVAVSKDTKLTIAKYILNKEIETGAKLTYNDVVKIALDKLTGDPVQVSGGNTDVGVRA